MKEKPGTAPRVSVCIITYNQADFIKMAIEGVLNQQTNFPFEFIISDDCSTDGTRAIVAEYVAMHPGIIIPVFHEKNMGSSANWQSLLQHPRSDYIAYFEGDDYYTDPTRLQKQYDFLEANPEYALVCTDYDVLFDDDNTRIDNFLKNRYRLDTETDVKLESYLFNRYYIRNVTTMYRLPVLKKYLATIDRDIIFNQAAGDLPWFLFILSEYKVKYLPGSTAVYRVLKDSKSRASGREARYIFRKRINRVLEYYITRNKMPTRYMKELRARTIMSEMEHDAWLRKPLKVIRWLMVLMLMLKFKKQALTNMWISVGGKPPYKDYL